MKSTILLFSLIAFISSNAIAQKDNGYFGKKGFLEVQTLGNVPLLYTAYFKDFSSASGYKADETSTAPRLLPKNDNFNYGFRVNAGYAVKRNLAISLEFGQDFASVYPNPYSRVDYSYNFNVVITHEMVDIKTTVIMPKFEFYTSNALSPMGLSHQLGLGVSFSNAIEKDYVYGRTDNNNYPLPTTLYENYSDKNDYVDPINFKEIETVKKYMLMYALNMRTPITKNLMINYGVKYTLSVGGPRESNLYLNPITSQNSSYTDELEYQISRSRTFSIINAFAGLTFVF
jgi:hypothetical protein